MEVKRKPRAICLVCGLSFIDKVNKTRGFSLDESQREDVLQNFCTYFKVRDEELKEEEVAGPSVSGNGAETVVDTENGEQRTLRDRKGRFQPAPKPEQNRKSIKIPENISVENWYPFPFCTDCRFSVVNLRELNQQLTIIKQNIDKAMTDISSKIVKTVWSERNGRDPAQFNRDHSKYTQNILRARQRIFSHWSPKVAICRTSTPPTANAEHLQVDCEPVVVVVPPGETSQSHGQVEENISSEANLIESGPEDIQNKEVEIMPGGVEAAQNMKETEVEILMEVSGGKPSSQESEDQNGKTAKSPSKNLQRENETTPRTAKPLKSILKTTENVHGRNKSPFSAISRSPYKSSQSGTPHRPGPRPRSFQIVDCGNGSFVYNGRWRFFECSKGFICGVKDCTFSSKWKDGIINHILSRHDDITARPKVRPVQLPAQNGSSVDVDVPLFGDGNSRGTSPSRIGYPDLTPQRNPQSPKPRPTKLSFSHTIAVKIEKVMESRSPPSPPASVPDPDPIPIPAPTPSPTAASTSQQSSSPDVISIENSIPTPPVVTISSPLKRMPSPAKLSLQFSPGVPKLKPPSIKTERRDRDLFTDAGSDRTTGAPPPKKVHLSQARQLLLDMQRI